MVILLKTYSHSHFVDVFNVYRIKLFSVCFGEHVYQMIDSMIVGSPQTVDYRAHNNRTNHNAHKVNKTPPLLSYIVLFQQFLNDFQNMLENNYNHHEQYIGVMQHHDKQKQLYRDFKKGEDINYVGNFSVKIKRNKE